MLILCFRRRPSTELTLCKVAILKCMAQQTRDNDPMLFQFWSATLAQHWTTLVQYLVFTEGGAYDSSSRQWQRQKMSVSVS